MFVGKIEAKTDAKGRVFVPAAMRRQLSDDSVVMRRDPNRRCLVLFPTEVFERKAQEMMTRLDTEWNPQDQQLLMEFTADVEQMPIDAQGRILLNKSNLDYLGASTTLLFVGMMDRIVVWDTETFNAQRMDATAFAQALNERMGRHETSQQQ
ncbi:MAG: cell division/cell wall cluster transcriptional repressor MraZ [Paludibacteraceae bacterium]|nr:cell division/cell wall cluster transcriptional repressor MraZ [Paludibacteraceae bacterium]